MKLKNFFKSLAFKLSLSIVLVIILTSISVGLIILEGWKNFMHKEWEKRGIYLAKMFSEQLVEPLLYEERFTIYKIFESSFNAEKDFLLYAEVYNLEGEPLLIFFKEEIIKRESQKKIFKDPQDLSIKKFSNHIEIFKIIEAKHYGPIGYLVLGIDSQKWKKNLAEVEKKVLLIVLGIIIGGILLALFLTRKIILPTQDSLIRAEKLSALGQLAAGLAHEIKNPLTTIKMLLQGSLKGEFYLEEGDLEIMEKEVSRIDKIVKDFLSFARITKREWKFFDLREIIKEVVEFCKKEFDLAKIDFQVHLPAEKIEFFGDEDSIKQICLNLLLNAYQAINSNYGKIDFKLEKKENFVKITVSDNGIGIPKEIRSKIFDPFFTTKSEGTGMGLAIVNSIVREYKGKIEVTSNTSKGTIFHIFLPVERKDGRC